MPPLRAIPKPARRARRSHCRGRSGASVAIRTMIEPAPSGVSGSGTTSAPILSPTGTPFTRRRSRWPWLACTRTPTIQPSGTTRDEVPIPPLKAWQTMPVPPPTEPSSTGPSAARSSASRTCSALTWKPLMSLRKPSQVSPTTGRLQSCSPGSSCGDERVADDSHRVGVRQPDRRRQETGVTHPLESRQLAVAVDPVRTGEERLDGRLHDGDAGPDVLALDQRRVADPSPGHIGDRIVRPGGEPADLDPEVACAGLHSASLTAVAGLEIDGELGRRPTVDLVGLLLDPLSLNLERMTELAVVDDRTRLVTVLRFSRPFGFGSEPDRNKPCVAGPPRRHGRRVLSRADSSSYRRSLRPCARPPGAPRRRSSF